MRRFWGTRPRVSSRVVSWRPWDPNRQFEASSRAQKHASGCLFCESGFASCRDAKLTRFDASESSYVFDHPRHPKSYSRNDFSLSPSDQDSKTHVASRIRCGILPMRPEFAIFVPRILPTILARAPVATPRIRNRAPHGPHTPTTRPAPQITRRAAPPRAASRTGTRAFPHPPSALTSAPPSHHKRQALVAPLEAAPKRSAPTLRACRADTSAPPSPNPPALLARTDFARDSSSISVLHQTPI